ncbi:MAG: hypothetical protein WDZ70_01035 [Candidatus Paceibacterota bacterium]
MKKILLVTALIIGFLAFSPISVDAHAGAEANTSMMSSEVSAEEFDEMQSVMIKMMNGEDLTTEESKEMIGFMQSHGEGHWPMGYGMMSQFDTSDGRYSMMWGGGSALMWLAGFASLVWLFVGILLILFLIKKISSK